MNILSMLCTGVVKVIHAITKRFAGIERRLADVALHISPHQKLFAEVDSVQFPRDGAQKIPLRPEQVCAAEYTGLGALPLCQGVRLPSIGPPRILS